MELNKSYLWKRQTEIWFITKINFIEWRGREGATSNDSIKVEQSVNHSYKHYLIILSNR